MNVDIKRICRAIVGGLILKAVIDKIEVETHVKRNTSSIVDYGTVVEAIMKSNMFDCDKIEAIELLKQNQHPSYYKAIISVIESNMFDCDKIEAIENINAN